MSLHSDAVRVPAAGGGFEAFGPAPAARPKRDVKKFALIVGLSVLAWFSTYTGMLELIQANLGEVGLVEKVATGLAVAMLQIMIVWLLDQLFSPIHASIKAFYIVGYFFLTLISVGFAFGFYWKVLESRSASTSSAESSISSVQNALRGTETRLDQLVSTLDALTGISTQKAEQESANGNSCPGSKPGAGPRMAMRRGDAEKFSFASNFVKGRSEQVKGDIKTIDVDLQRILKDDKTIVDAKSGTRNEFLKGTGRKLEETTTRYNALRTDPQLRQIRQDSAERAEKTTFADTKGGTYACPDGQLQSALRGVVAAIDQLPTLEKPKIAATEGSEAVIEAFRRLTMSLAGAMQFKLPPTPEELREKQAKAVQSMENPVAAAQNAAKAINMDAAGLGKRDYIPLGIAIFVDFCLLMVSFGRPANRFAKTAMELKAAELGPQSAIVGINREVHEDRLVRRNFELFQHVVIHFGNHYLAAVPLAPPRHTPDGRELSDAERERLAIEAQTLVTLFSGLELNNAVVDRGLPPILLLMGGSRLVRARLLKQESKFARAGAFRYYRFRNRAWPEMILGTVMGTANKYKDELAANRAEDAENEKEQRRLDREERKADNAQRKADNAKKIAEAELRTIEAQLRQRDIEEQLRQAAQMRGQRAVQQPGPHAGQRPFAPVQHPGVGHPQMGHPQMNGQHPMNGQHMNGQHLNGQHLGGGPRGMQRPGGQHPQAMPGAGHAAGPGPMGSPFPAPYGQPPAPQPHGAYPHGHPHDGHQGGHPMRAMNPAASAYGPATIIEPANHNTGPAERGRGQSAEMRPLPHNVVAMPDRFERMQATEAQPTASANAPTAPPQPVTAGVSQPTSMELAQAALARAQAGSAPQPAPLQLQTPAGIEPASAKTDLSTLLRTVAVTQMRVAHDVAEAVQRIEGRADRSIADAAGEHRTIEGKAIEMQIGEMQIAETGADPAQGIEDGAPVREQQAWREAGPAIHDDMKRAFSGRGLAHDPALDDAGSIAARYAPTQRPH